MGRMEAILIALVLLLALGLPMAIRGMKRWLRHSRTGGFVGSVGAGIAGQIDPARAMLETELENEQNRKGEKEDEGL